MRGSSRGTYLSSPRRAAESCGSHGRRGPSRLRHGVGRYEGRRVQAALTAARHRSATTGSRARGPPARRGVGRPGLDALIRHAASLLMCPMTRRCSGLSRDWSGVHLPAREVTGQPTGPMSTSTAFMHAPSKAPRLIVPSSHRGPTPGHCRANHGGRARVTTTAAATEGMTCTRASRPTPGRRQLISSLPPILRRAP